MKLHNYETGDFMRMATLAEYESSVAASKIDGGAGVITIDGLRCYVEGEPESGLKNEDLIAMAHELGAEPCGDPRCENGTIVGDEYVTRAGDVDNYTWDCSTCNPTPKVYTWDDNTEVPF